MALGTIGLRDELAILVSSCGYRHIRGKFAYERPRSCDDEVTPACVLDHHSRQQPAWAATHASWRPGPSRVRACEARNHYGHSGATLVRRRHMITFHCTRVAPAHSGGAWAHQQRRARPSGQFSKLE